MAGGDNGCEGCAVRGECQAETPLRHLALLAQWFWRPASSGPPATAPGLGGLGVLNGRGAGQLARA